MKMTGAQILLKCLEREGVKHIFGYPGGVVLDIYDELTRTPQIQHILVRHEQGAVHAADGYARVSGKVGVCIATSGPGATNLVTGIANAYMDSVPLVVLTGQVPTIQIGTDAFQEVDITGITLPITKHNYLVEGHQPTGPDHPRGLSDRPVRAARSGAIDLPKDVVQASMSKGAPAGVSVVVIGLNHRTVPLDLLERMTIDDAAPAARPCTTSAAGEHVSEAVVLSTCNRTEIYVVAERSTAPTSDVRNFLVRDGLPAARGLRRPPLRPLRRGRRSPTCSRWRRASTRR